MATGDRSISEVREQLLLLLCLVRDFSKFQRRHKISNAETLIAWNALTFKFVSLSAEMTQIMLKEGVKNGF